MQKVNNTSRQHKFEAKDKTAKLLSYLRATEGKALNLFRTKKYVQLICLSDGLEHHLEQYYRQVEGKLTIEWQRDKLALTYNRALYSLKNGGAQETVHMLMKAIKYINGQLDQQKSSLGFMDQDDSFLVKQQWILMDKWQLELAKFYYYLAVVSSRTNSRQVSLASVLKSLNLIQELYESRNTQCKIKCFQMKSKEDLEVQDLLGVCHLRENLSHSKKLENIPEKTLLSVLNWLLHEPYIIAQNSQNSSFSIFGEVATLSLQTGESNSIEEWQKEFINMKKLHCLNLHLLSQLQWTEQECYELSEGGSKDTLLNSILVTYILKQYLAPSAAFNKILSQYTCQFGSLTYRKQTLSFTNLLKAFGLSQNDIVNPEPLTSSCFKHPRLNSSQIHDDKANPRGKKSPSKPKKGRTNRLKLVISLGSKKVAHRQTGSTRKKEKALKLINLAHNTTMEQTIIERAKWQGRQTHRSCKKNK